MNTFKCEIIVFIITSIGLLFKTYYFIFQNYIVSFHVLFALYSIMRAKFKTENLKRMIWRFEVDRSDGWTSLNAALTRLPWCKGSSGTHRLQKESDDSMINAHLCKRSQNESERVVRRKTREKKKKASQRANKNEARKQLKMRCCTASTAAGRVNFKAQLGHVIRLS